MREAPAFCVKFSRKDRCSTARVSFGDKTIAGLLAQFGDALEELLGQGGVSRFAAQIVQLAGIFPVADIRNARRANPSARFLECGGPSRFSGLHQSRKRG